MKHDSKPLTVDQMREMHDKVVIVKTLEYGQESKGILDFSDPNDSDNGVYVGCEFYSVESYGFFGWPMLRSRLTLTHGNRAKNAGLAFLAHTF